MGCNLKNLPPPESPEQKWFSRLEYNEYRLIRKAQESGAFIAGLYCEYAPFELVVAAGGIPVCLCGYSNEMIAPAESVLPSNLCPLIKSSFGYFLTDEHPFFTDSDVIIAETTCDGKKKMFELLSRKLGKEVFLLELPQSQVSERSRNEWRSEIARLWEYLCERYKVPPAGREERLRQAIRLMNSERRAFTDFFDLGAHKPSPIGWAQQLMVRPHIRGQKQFVDKLNKLTAEYRAKITHGDLPAKEGPRVLVTGVPIGMGSHKVLETIEDAGGRVVVQENCNGYKPQYVLADECAPPLEAIADKYLAIPCSCMTPNDERIRLLDRLIREFHVDAVVELVWQACHTYNVEAHFIAAAVKEMGKPYLKIETDYSPSDREQIRLRVESLLDMVRR
ncbi:MAG: double-cubane-cluster-containing anaerobic reductase [Candidatus Brocadiia bacterium]